MSSIQKIEIVKPYRRYELPTEFIVGLVITGLRVLLLWWAVAAWFPEFGITYWQMILPVMALRGLFNNPAYKGRTIFWRNVFRSKAEKIEGTVEEAYEYAPKKTD